MTIGTFSRASLLSIKTLRAYHEAGILVPAQVDPRTGYRVYHSSQLTDAAVVLRLRSLDLPLDKVREVVTARDPEVTQRVLAEHTATMRSRLDEVARIVTELQDTATHPEAHTPVHVRDQPATHTLFVRGRVSEATFVEFLDGAYDELERMATRRGRRARCTRPRSSTTRRRTSRPSSRWPRRWRCRPTGAAWAWARCPRPGWRW